ncbi:MAG: tyrosine-type recombinase/integrase [Bradyrhizobium sp.]|jgi:integrase|uniref:tyrosine-type recombinase/integrase n=1 Tax=Bradyrhizobium sp. TaxID=376 RepID=UPI003C7A80B0
MKLNLTDDKVGKFKLAPDMPDGKIIFDEKLSGFGVRVYRSGSKIWVYQFRLAGRSDKYVIGQVSAIAAIKARAEAKIAAGHVAKGENPNEIRRQAEAKHKEQFGELVTEYLDEKLRPIKPGKKPMRPRSYAEVKRHLEDHCRPFKYRAIKGISQDDVATLYKKISRSAGPGAASHVWSTGRAFMQWCMGRGILEKNVFALYDGGGTNEPRERTLDDTELAIVWKACSDDQFGNIVKLLILTGARRDEVGHMHVDELTLDSTPWVKPMWLLHEDRAKNRREHLVPLTGHALELLTKATEGRQAHVFGYGETRGFSGWSKAKAALDKRLKEAGHELDHWTLHDLRRSFANGLQRLKIEPHVIEACLNHSTSKLQRTYQTHDYEDERRTALKLWAEHIDAVTRNGHNVRDIQEAAS